MCNRITFYAQHIEQDKHLAKLDKCDFRSNSRDFRYSFVDNNFYIHKQVTVLDMQVVYGQGSLLRTI